MRASIGETLARQPGVSATSFGPTASAPVLRGLSGDRVRVLTDGIGSLDLSSSGPDHAIAINPSPRSASKCCAARRRLVFGSSAIGGVVNVIDTRIPRRMPKNAVGVEALAGYGTAADDRLVNGSVDVPLAGKFVIHVDGNWQKSDDLRTGGHILSKELRRQALASPDPEIQALADLKGDLPNSAAESKEGAIGVAYVDGGLNIGASVTRHLATYQVPIRYSLDPAIEPEAPTIDQKQTRYDFRAEIPVSGFFSHVRARGGYANYHHDELEDTGEIGSSFFSKGGEGRFELVQSERSGWGGTSGLQYLDRNARIVGEEKFLPDSRQRQAGLFTLQTLVSGKLRVEGGARVEFSKLSADADDQLLTPERSRNFTTWSGSLGGQYEFSPGWRAGLTRFAKLARSVDRRIIRKRSAWREPVVRDRQSRPRSGSQPQRRGRVAAAIGPAHAERERLLQPFFELHLPGPDRRASGRLAGVPIPAGTSRLLRVRDPGGGQVRRGVRNQVEGRNPGGCRPCHGEGFRARRR